MSYPTRDIVTGHRGTVVMHVPAPHTSTRRQPISRLRVTAQTKSPRACGPVISLDGWRKEKPVFSVALETSTGTSQLQGHRRQKFCECAEDVKHVPCRKQADVPIALISSSYQLHGLLHYYPNPQNAYVVDGLHLLVAGSSQVTVYKVGRIPGGPSASHGGTRGPVPRPTLVGEWSLSQRIANRSKG